MTLVTTGLSKPKALWALSSKGGSGSGLRSTRIRIRPWRKILILIHPVIRTLKKKIIRIQPTHPDPQSLLFSPLPQSSVSASHKKVESKSEFIQELFRIRIQLFFGLDPVSKKRVRSPESVFDICTNLLKIKFSYKRRTYFAFLRLPLVKNKFWGS